MACFFETMRDDEMTVISRLSANQLERAAASPRARYLVMEEKTENSPAGDWGRDWEVEMNCLFWAPAARLRHSRAEARAICSGFFIPGI